MKSQVWVASGRYRSRLVRLREIEHDGEGFPWTLTDDAGVEYVQDGAPFTDSKPQYIPVAWLKAFEDDDESDED